MENELLRGRVSTVNRSNFEIIYNEISYLCEMSGRFRYQIYSKEDYPLVGDYVLFRDLDFNKGIIESIVDRKNTLHRLGVSTTGAEQYFAANIDIVFVCMSVNEDFNIRKLQNLLNISYGNKHEVVILLTKSDLNDEIDELIKEVKTINDIDEIIVVSTLDETSMMKVEEKISNKTGVLIGASGVGKSSIINYLIGYEHFDVNGIRQSDAQGRHTTSHRELIKLKKGYIIDTPGIRVINSGIVDDIEEHFEDLVEFSEGCEFRDCSHNHEPGCNVLQAIDDGVLNIERLIAYRKVVRFNNFTENRNALRARKNKKQRR